MFLAKNQSYFEIQRYEIECHKQNWSKRELQQQVASSLFERLALSRNKDEIMRLATEGKHLRPTICTLFARKESFATETSGMD